MSTKYGATDRVPTEILAARLDELSIAVTQGKEAVSREFTMRIPAEMDRDADLVLYAAASRLRELEQKNEQNKLRGTYPAHSCDIEGCAVCDPCYGL